MFCTFRAHGNMCNSFSQDYFYRLIFIIQIAELTKENLFQPRQKKKTRQRTRGFKSKPTEWLRLALPVLIMRWSEFLSRCPWTWDTQLRPSWICRPLVSMTPLNVMSHIFPTADSDCSCCNNPDFDEWSGLWCGTSMMPFSPAFATPGQKVTASLSGLLVTYTSSTKGAIFVCNRLFVKAPPVPVSL